MLHGGHDPRAGGAWERGFLTLVYVLARPLARAGVRPSPVTAASVVCAAAALGVAALGGRWALAAGLLVVVSAVLDGVDGAVAVLTDRVSRWGHVVDSLADRISEALFLAALWISGAPGELCLLAGALGWLHEYLRARAATAGMGGIGLVTVGERPTRVIFAAASLAAAGLGSGPIATVGVAAWAVFAGAGLAQLLLAVRRALR